MILGIGIDIVEIARIDSLLNKFQDHFLNKIYTEQERDFCYGRNDIANSLAKMFSLKEATIKALSDAKGIKWHEMEIIHDKNGKPEIKLTGMALKKALEKSKSYKIYATTSDEKLYAVACVILES